MNEPGFPVCIRLRPCLEIRGLSVLKAGYRQTCPEAPKTPLPPSAEMHPKQKWFYCWRSADPREPMVHPDYAPKKTMLTISFFRARIEVSIRLIPLRQVKPTLA